MKCRKIFILLPDNSEVHIKINSSSKQVFAYLFWSIKANLKHLKLAYIVPETFYFQSYQRLNVERTDNELRTDADWMVDERRTQEFREERANAERGLRTNASAKWTEKHGKRNVNVTFGKTSCVFFSTESLILPR